MDTVKERKVMKWVEPDRKLTDEEIHEMLECFDYESYEKEAYENEDYVPGPVWDRFGNPTRDTFAAKYEDIHGIGDNLTWEEFCDELRELYEETEPCVSLDRNDSLRAI